MLFTHNNFSVRDYNVSKIEFPDKAKLLKLWTLRKALCRITYRSYRPEVLKLFWHTARISEKIITLRFWNLSVFKQINSGLPVPTEFSGLFPSEARCPASGSSDVDSYFSDLNVHMNFGGILLKCRFLVKYVWGEPWDYFLRCSHPLLMLFQEPPSDLLKFLR